MGGRGGRVEGVGERVEGVRRGWEDEEVHKMRSVVKWWR